MNFRKIVVRTTLALVGLPVLLVLIVAVAFYARFYTTPRANGTIISSGKKREYLLHVPTSYDRSKPTPLVISMHGAMLWPAAQMATSHWNEQADQHGFIVVYPSGTTLRHNGTGVLPKAWLTAPQATLDVEVRFISELIDTLEAAYNIDPTRIYANGLSNGGAMTFALSCRLSDRIAAVGTVSAAQDLPWSWCAGAPPMPAILFHGTADPLVPYHGAPASWLAPRPFPDVPAWTANWAQRNRCSPNPVDTTIAVDVTRREYRNCADSATVLLYTIRGGGHAWPGGTPMPKLIVGSTTRSIDATSLMWAFFREHQLVRSGR